MRRASIAQTFVHTLIKWQNAANEPLTDCGTNVARRIGARFRAQVASGSPGARFWRKTEMPIEAGRIRRFSLNRHRLPATAHLATIAAFY